MGFFDFFAGDNGESIGNWLGVAGDMLGIGSAFSEGKAAEGLGLGAGIASTLSGINGVFSGIGNVMKGKDIKESGNIEKGKKKEDDGWWGIADSSLGALGGVADIVTSSYGLKAENEQDPVKKKELLKKKGGWQKASGVLGILGGAVSGIKSIRDITKANDTKEKKDAWIGLAGGVTKLVSGIGNFGAGFYTTADDKNPSKQRWDKMGKGMSIIGAIPGMLGSVI